MKPEQELAQTQDAKVFLDRALESKIGYANIFTEKKLAESFRHRLYKFRLAERRLSKKVHPSIEDPLHGTSAYDSLVIDMIESPGGRFSVHAIKSGLRIPPGFIKAIDLDETEE